MQSDAKVGECDSGNRHNKNPAIKEFIRPAPTIREKKRSTVNELEGDDGARAWGCALGLSALSSDIKAVDARIDGGIALHNPQRSAKRYGIRIKSAKILKSAIWASGEDRS